MSKHSTAFCQCLDEKILHDIATAKAANGRAQTSESQCTHLWMCVSGLLEGEVWLSNCVYSLTHSLKHPYR